MASSIHNKSSTTPPVQSSIARALDRFQFNGAQEDALEEQETDDESDSDLSTIRQVASGASVSHSFVGSYRRPSFTFAGGRAALSVGSRDLQRNPTKAERHEGRRDERSLLRDNNVIPPKHPQKGEASESFTSRLHKHFSNAGIDIPGGDRKAVSTREEAEAESEGRNDAHTETTPLLGNPELPYGGQDDPKNIQVKWEEAVMQGKIKTTWQREAKVLGRYSAPLVLTFLLQYSLTVASIFTVGHLGKVELGAVSLASMTSNITGYAIYQGRPP